MLFSRKKNDEPSTLHTVIESMMGITLGVSIAVAWLVFKPVTVLDAPPVEKKDGVAPARHAVVYVSGRQGQVRQSTYSARVKAFAARDTLGIEVPEQDLNRWVATTYADVERLKKWEYPPVDLQIGMPVFRFDGNRVEVGSVGELTALGEWKRKLVVHAKGTFAQTDGKFQFVPAKVYVGSCPVPFGFLSKRVFDAVASVFEPGADARAVWSAVNDVQVEKSRLLIGFAGTPKPIEAAASAPAPVSLPTVEPVTAPPIEQTPALVPAPAQTSEPVPPSLEGTPAAEASAALPVEGLPGDAPPVEAPVAEAPAVPAPGGGV